MTVQEILKSVKFEDITEKLVEIDFHAADNLYSFKEAFDNLCLMQPDNEDVDIPVEISEECEDGESILSVYFKERGLWKTLLPRKVIINAPNATMPEIAAALLWEITYYGFSDEECVDNFKLFDDDNNVNSKNPYVTKYNKLRQRYFDITCKNKSDFMKQTVRIERVSDLFWRPRKNGPKRHRDKRIEARLKVLERNVRRWDLWNKLKTMSGLKEETAGILLQHMISGSPFSHYYMESRTADGSDIDYITDMIINYFPSREGSKSIVMVTAPSKFYQGEELQQSVWEAFGYYLKLPSPKYIWATNESRQNIRVEILVFT